MADKNPFLGNKHVPTIFASERAVNNPYETNKSESNQPPTFGEEHLREDTVSPHVSGTKEVVTEDLRNVKTFQLCLAAPASISCCSAYLTYKGIEGLLDPEPVGLHLEPTLGALGLKFNFWFSDILPSRDGRIFTEIAYHLTLRDARVPTRFSNPFVAVARVVAKNARGGGNPESKRVVIQIVLGLQNSLLLRFDVVDERGLLLKNHSLGVAQWLAVLTQIIFVANPSNIAECVREYWKIRHGHEQKESLAIQNHSRDAYSTVGVGADSSSSSDYGGNHGVNYDVNYGVNYGSKPFLGTVAIWAARVADKYGGSITDAAAHNKTIGMKMFLLCLGLFEVLKELASREGAQAEGKLYDVYAIVLSCLRKVSPANGGCGYESPPFAIAIFRDGISELVMCISRFSYDWISLLETLGRYDRSWIFLEKVSEFQLDMREVSMLKNSQLAYMDAVKNVLKTNDIFSKEKALRRRTYRITLLASPTFPSFLLAAEELQAWMRVAAVRGQTENTEEEIHTELEDGLHQWFTKVMPEMMNPSNNNRPKATYLQQHLELIVEHVKLEPVFANCVLPPFLASSFRRHVMEMLHQTMSKNSDSSADLVETIHSIVLEYPFTFSLPLLLAEGQLLLKFASSDIDAYVYMSKIIIIKLGSSDGDPRPEDMEYLSEGVLRPWLLAYFSQRQPSSPLSYFMFVQEVFDMGVDASSVFGSCLTQAAIASSLQKFRALQQFLVGSVGVSQLGESLQSQYLNTIIDMMQRQLDSATNVAELDTISEEILRGLCAQHGHGGLSFIEKTQEELCVALLNKMAEHTGFVENLSMKRAFQTISTSNFASCLLQIQAAPSSPIKEHWIYVKVREACRSFACSVMVGEVTMGTVESVSRTCHKWKSIFRSIFPVGYDSVSSALDKAFQDLELYEKRLQACDRLANLCRYLSVKGYPIQGIQEWVADLKTRRETLMSTPLRGTVHWPQEVHPSLFDNLESLLLLHESEIFRCILLDSCRRLFEQRLKDEQLPSLVEIVEGSNSNATPDATHNATFAMIAGDLVPSSIQRYRVEMEPYCGTKNLENTNMEKLYSVWVTVGELQIEREFELARSELKVEDPKSGWGNKWEKALDINDSMKAWKAIKSKEELVAALRKVANLFQFDDSCEGYVEKMNHLMNQCDEYCTWKEFTELYQKQGMRLLAKLSRNEVFAFMQLAKSEPLINFLRAKGNEDFRNLIDAVEEGSGNDFVQPESILSDLINLHRIFRPVLMSRTPTFAQLRNVMFSELKTSAGSELVSVSTLAAKLSKCNENVAQISQFLSSVTNRGMRMKDHMKRILRGGEYHFTLKDTVHDVKLTCDSETKFRYVSPTYNSGVRVREESYTYNLADLQVLRSRARLVLSTHEAQVKRYKSDEADSAETEEDTGLFIAQVDVVEHLVTSISELCASGHLHWAQFDYPELSGLQELQNLARFVERELREWYAVVKQARITHSCLNYFRSMELRLLLEVLCGSGTRHSEMSSTRAEDLCIEILQWAGMTDPRGALKEAQKNYSRDSMDQRNGYTPLSQVLELIAKSLEPLFRRQPALSRKSKFIDGSQRRNEALLLTLVEESHMEQQAVLSLFHERHLSLRDVPSNVLFCSSFTTWEEIHLLLLRFFQRTAQDVGLFCIAYFEKLSFECQSQFLKVLQEMVHEWEEKHHRRISEESEDCEVQLAVVCCSKSEALLTVSHHLNVRVCRMEALNSVEVRRQLPTECANMHVITSELPGLGKTRRVNNIHTPDDVRTLCVSGNTSRNSLVSQLKELALQPKSILHLEISSVVNPETFNVLLFELLVLGCLKSDVAGVLHLNTETDVHIELGNMLSNELALSLPICDWFQREHLTWDLNSLEVSGDPNSDMQVVCIYLQSLESEDLDSNDLIFSGAASNVTALPSILCRDLLKRNFIDHCQEETAMSFTVLEMFVQFLACQLRSFTGSVYFQVDHLKYMEAMDNIRSCLVTSLVEVSRDLSLRSVKPWLHEQQQSRGKKITDLTMETRFQGMLRWSDSNLLMIFFQSEGSVSFLYRNINLLPVSVTQLVNSQRFSDEEQVMPDYAAMSSRELWSNLWPILQRSQPSIQPTYVLTADSFLKMVLISLRVAAQVPILIMGETGCGKTSLLRVLAKYCGVKFSSMTLHAGTTDEDIRFFINKSNEAAILENESGESKKVWAFLDEINACDHLGFLNGVICHHLLDGQALDANLVVLAACNPYRRKDKENSQVGFSPCDLIMNPGDVERDNLAYRVHPLPEAMLDYVWDFGLLSRLDEQAYIGAMVQEKVKPSQVQLFADLLVISQHFIRECHGEASVSLRDASRSISLYDYFLKDVLKRPLRTRGPFRKNDNRAMLLAFSHCYHSRLATEQQ